MRVDVVRGDLLDQDVDVIVNAWNRNVIPWWLLLPQGVSGAIKRRAGYAPFREVGRHGPIPLGEAVLTSAGKLPHKAIIHVAGINLLWFSSEFAIRASARNAVQLAEKHDFSTIAFPVIGAGSGKYSAAKAKEILVEELTRLESQMTAKVVVYDKKRRRRTNGG